MATVYLFLCKLFQELQDSQTTPSLYDVLSLFIFLTRVLRNLKRTTKMIVLSNIIYIFQYRTNPMTVAIEVVEGKAETLIPNFYLDLRSYFVKTTRSDASRSISSIIN